MENVLNVVYITDEKYAMPTCVSILSLIMNMEKQMKLSIYILADDISKDSQNR